MRLIEGISSPKSRISNMSNHTRRRKKNKSREPRNDTQELLDYNLGLMTTFDYDKFKEGTNYVSSLIESMGDQSVTYLLAQNFNKIIITYTEVINGVMPMAVNYSLDAPKYMTIFSPLQKLIATEKLMNNIEENAIHPMICCVIEKLVNSNQEKDELDQYVKSSGDPEIQQKHHTAECVTKGLNSIMLKIIQRCHPTLLIKSLFDVLVKSRQNPQWPERKLQKTNSLSAKCILRSIKKIPENLEKMNLSEVFYAMLMYTENFQESSQDANAWKIFRGMINEIVKNLDTANIWNSYTEASNGNTETKVAKWIKAAQMNLQRSMMDSQILPSHSNYGSHPRRNSTHQQNPVHGHQHLLDLIASINRQTRISKVRKLLGEIIKYVQMNPSVDIEHFGTFFSNKTYFQKLMNAINAGDNISDMHSVISTNTRKTNNESSYNYRPNPNNKSYRSINRSGMRKGRH
jgi:hypothetical protein